MKKLKVTFDEPQGGYWDGGEKDGGIFELEDILDKHPGPGRWLKWGCWSLNFWFLSKSGRTWNEAASIAQRKLCSLLKIPSSVIIME